MTNNLEAAAEAANIAHAEVVAAITAGADAEAAYAAFDAADAAYEAAADAAWETARALDKRPATGPGALDYYTITCGCGLELRNSLETGILNDADQHQAWHDERGDAYSTANIGDAASKAREDYKRRLEGYGLLGLRANR